MKHVQDENMNSNRYHNLRRNIATNKKYILRQKKIRNPKFNNLFSIMFCVITCEPFGVKRSMRPF